MSPFKPHTAARRFQRGLSLVEILVGVLIGMIGIVVIFQVLAVAEARKRTTVQGSDAQTAGAIALYTLQRELQVAGLGFGTAHARQLGCTVRVYDATRPTENADFKLHPIEITQGALGAPDTIAVLFGIPTQFVTSGDDLKAWTATAPDAFKTLAGGRAGFDFGDLLLLTSAPKDATIGELPSKIATECALVQVTHRDPADPNKIDHKDSWESPPPAGITLPPATALQTSGGNPRFNKSVGWPSAPNFTATGGVALNLGKQPRRVVWSVASNRLRFVETLANTPGADVADGIINLQAEYGIDTDNNNVIAADEWTVTPPDTTALPSDLNAPCNDKPSRSWRCVRAIRTALLARSDQWDKTACSPNPQWTSGATGALVLTSFAMSNLDGTADSFGGCAEDPPSPNNWRRYRYSVYETVIPLRNMIWGTAP